MSKHSPVVGKTPTQAARAQTAAKRKEAHAERSAQEQLELLGTRPGDSAREVKRLTGLLVKEDAPVRETAPAKRPRTRRKKGA